MKIVEADKLKKCKRFVCEDYKACDDKETICSEITDVDKQPVINKPMKHGYWKKWCRLYLCSECGRSVPQFIFFDKCDYDFCPNCGARMNRENNVE